jgi:hypothetical protein
MPSLNFRHITNTIFVAGLKQIGFSRKKKNTSSNTFCFRGDFGHIFFFEKLAEKNSLNFFLYKHGSKFPLFTCSVRQLGLVKGEEKIKKMLSYPFDDFYFENEDELIGLYDMVYELLKNNIYDFFYNDLDEEIFNYCIEDRKAFLDKYKECSITDMNIIMHKLREDWVNQRFTERKNFIP